MTRPAILRRTIEHAVRVAARTLCGHVSSRQWEIRLPVIKRRWLPRRLRMTFKAILRERCNDMIRIHNLLIVQLVTRPAILRRTIEHAVRVAARTLCGHVSSRQWEIRLPVIKRRWLPRRLRMTLHTVLRERCSDVVRVHHLFVVQLVTGPAILGRTVKHAVCVAARALSRHVSARQWKVCLPVIERRWLPCRGRMAFNAVLRKRSSDVIRIHSLLIVQLVTRPAVLRRPLEHTVRVTTCALCGQVSARKRKVCSAVIEQRGLPGHITVTLETILREGSDDVVGCRDAFVIGTMTAPAVLWRTVVHPVYVTTCAISYYVSTGKRKAGTGVIKCCRCKCDFGVTDFAIRRESRRCVVR